ncbi:MAG TPA: hypothetical protein VER17_16050 [Tepidisphaeraceae bacterium]|nr:hypothetical protein [Tepidisphaeraceae bacterium]
MPKVVLFLCTGNYYRSRFAQVLFNHLARLRELDWRALSRGLNIRCPGNIGAMSRDAEHRLAEMGVSLEESRHMPLRCRACDLDAADLIVAVKEAEHRPMLAEQFPDWQQRATYWHVHDVEAAAPAEALAEIERHVVALVERLDDAAFRGQSSST